MALLTFTENENSSHHSRMNICSELGGTFFRGEKAAPMEKGRREAFSDGVIAIIITIMVLELKVPHAAPKPRGRAVHSGGASVRVGRRVRGRSR